MSQNNGYRNRLVDGRGFDRDLEYVHQEYPKLIDGPDGSRITVNDEAEEKAALAVVEEPEAPKEDKKPGKKDDKKNSAQDSLE